MPDRTASPLQPNRRAFLKLTTLGLAGMGLSAWTADPARLADPDIPLFPDSPRLGRVVWWGSELKSRPSTEAATLDSLPEDTVVAWLREVVGYHPTEINQRWVETPQGYLWSPRVQPVRNQPNAPRTSLPSTSLGEGMWVEVSVPYSDLILDNPPARSPWLQDRLEYGLSPRLYYSQVVWVDQIKTDELGQAWYRVNERYGYGDVFWARGEAFRPITPGEMQPIDPQVEEKRIVVDISRQSLACYEGPTEVYYCRISSGALFNAQGERVDAWATPLGRHPIWRKLVSLHMSGGTTGGGWDLPGIGWTSLFVGSGVAIHSTFFHNNFGVPMSRGCINARPDDAKWIFRWTLPEVPYDPGDVTVKLPGGTLVEVVES